MFGIGMPEMLLILALALIIIGPKKLPDLAKSLGRAIGEFKKATSELKESMEIDTELKDVKKAFDGMPADTAVTGEAPVAAGDEKVPLKKTTSLEDPPVSRQTPALDSERPELQNPDGSKGPSENG